jgi:hypothetical protein
MDFEVRALAADERAAYVVPHFWIFHVSSVILATARGI